MNSKNDCFYSKHRKIGHSRQIFSRFLRGLPGRDDLCPSCVFLSPPAIFPLLRTEDYGEDSAGFGERSWPTLKISEGWLALS